MDKYGAFDFIKHKTMSNITQWFKQMDIVSYGVVTKILSDGIVEVERVVRDGLAKKILRVPVLTTNSTLFEGGAAPSEGDLVLLLFLDRYNRNMFDAPKPRHDANKNDWSINDPNAIGYNQFSGIAILLGPARGFAETVVKHYMQADVPNMSVRSRAKIQASFAREISVIFDAMPEGSTLADKVISLIFGTHSPVELDYRAPVTRLHGFSVKHDKTLEAVDATVTETYSPNAPIIKNIQAPITAKIGKGYNTAGDPTSGDKDVGANITITLGTKADITINSKSNCSVTFDKAVVTMNKDGTITAQNDNGSIILNSDGTSTLKTASNSLKTLMDDLLDTIVGMSTFGPPPLHTVLPADIAKFQALKAKFDLLLKA